MEIGTKEAAGVVASGGGLLWLWAKLIRREFAEHRVDKANQTLIAELMAEKGQLLEQIEAKDKTINRLIEEKEQILKQVAEIPTLKTQVEELENKVSHLSDLLSGMCSLTMHVLLDVDPDSMSPSLKDKIKLELPKFQAGIVGNT